MFVKLASLVAVSLLAATSLAAQIVVDLSHGEAPPNLISINKDDSLKVVLEENPSTGFAWMVNQRKIPQSKKVLQIANQTYIDPPQVDGQDPLLGAPGIKEIVFLPSNALVGAGGLIRSKIRNQRGASSETASETEELIYARPWELKDVMFLDGSIDWNKANQLGYSIETMNLNVQVNLKP